MKNIILTCILILLVTTISAQNKPHSKGSIYGKIIDKSAKEALEFSNVILKSAKDSTIVNGTITDEKGNFKLSDIPYGSYFVEVMSLGYETKTIHDIKLDANNTFVNLKNISIGIAAEMLGEVEIVEQVNEIDYKLDKKVVHVNQDIVSAGATAVEVLENVPSVSTDIDGNVSLRGSESFLVLIDGRPSPLSGSEALQQIPASSIENIEIITNPSAKYAADGVGGIINIVLKKNKRKGYNGQISANYGSFNSCGIDALFNFRLEKINFFVGGQFGMRNNKGTGFSIRETYLNSDTTLFLKTNGNNEMKGYNGNVRAGFDLYITDNDILTISGKYNRYKRARNSDKFTQNYFTDFENTLFNENYYLNEIAFDLQGGYYSGDINYYKKFKKEGHELQAYFNFASDFDNEFNNYSQYSTDSQENKYTPDVRDNANQTSTVYGGRKYNAKIDYVLPLMKQAKFEAGWDMQYSIHDNDYNYEVLNGNDFQTVDSMHNPYRFTNDIQSLYVLFSDIRGKFGYQLGVRAELTDRNFHQNESNVDWKYRDMNLFPSLHLSYALPHNMDIMASYSRRLRRPQSHFLDPFIEIQDANNIRQGNPYLEPEYTHSVELNFQKKIKTHFISIELFARQTSHKMDRITTIHPLYDSIFVSTFMNVGKDLSAGTELMVNVNAFKWWNITLTGDLYYYQIIPETIGLDNKHSINWNIRMNNTWRITKWGTMLQFGCNYRAPQVTAQGKRYGSFMSQMGIRQDFLNKTLSVSFSLRDIFRTGTWKNESRSERFYEYSENRRFSPTFNISVSYKLNDFQKRKEKITEDAAIGDDDM